MLNVWARRPKCNTHSCLDVILSAVQLLEAAWYARHYDNVQVSTREGREGRHEGPLTKP